MDHKITFLSRTSPTIFSGLLFLWILVITHPLYPRLEGYLFPVVEGVQLTSVELSPKNFQKTRVEGTFQRNRDCAYIRLDWYIGTIEDGALVPIEFLAGAKDRDTGLEEFGPWDIAMTPTQFKKSEAIAVHRCHPFWLTETIFWKSE